MRGRSVVLLRYFGTKQSRSSRHVLLLGRLTPVCLIDEQGLISAQGGIYQKINKRTGPNHYYTVVPNKSAQGGFFFQKK